MAIYLLGGHQSDFARAWSREGLDISDMMRDLQITMLIHDNTDAAWHANLSNLQKEKINDRFTVYRSAQ